MSNSNNTVSKNNQIKMIKLTDEIETEKTNETVMLYSTFGFSKMAEV